MRSLMLLVFVIASNAFCQPIKGKQCPPRTGAATALLWLEAAADVPADMMLEFKGVPDFRSSGICTHTRPMVLGIYIWSGKNLLELHTIKPTGDEAKSFSKSNGQILYIPSEQVLAALDKYKTKSVRITVWAKAARGKYVKPVRATDSDSNT